MKVLSLKPVVCYNKISQCALISQLLHVVCSNTVLISADVLTDFCVSYFMLGQFTIGCKHFNNIKQYFVAVIRFCSLCFIRTKTDLTGNGE